MQNDRGSSIDCNCLILRSCHGPISLWLWIAPCRAVVANGRPAHCCGLYAVYQCCFCDCGDRHCLLADAMWVLVSMVRSILSIHPERDIILFDCCVSLGTTRRQDLSTYCNLQSSTASMLHLLRGFLNCGGLSLLGWSFAISELFNE